jgi:hypothetical protein
MTHVNFSTDDPAATSGPCSGRAVPTCRGSEQQCCGLRLLSPPDALTRMLMKADGVTEAYLDALVRSVAKAHARRSVLLEPAGTLVSTPAP